MLAFKFFSKKVKFLKKSTKKLSSKYKRVYKVKLYFMENLILHNVGILLISIRLDSKQNYIAVKVSLFIMKNGCKLGQRFFEKTFILTMVPLVLHPHGIVSTFLKLNSWSLRVSFIPIISTKEIN